MKDLWSTCKEFSSGKMNTLSQISFLLQLLFSRLGQPRALHTALKTRDRVFLAQHINGMKKAAEESSCSHFTQGSPCNLSLAAVCTEVQGWAHAQDSRELNQEMRNLTSKEKFDFLEESCEIPTTCPAQHKPACFPDIWWSDESRDGLRFLFLLFRLAFSSSGAF